MRKFGLFLIVLALVVSACDSSVKIRGDVKGLKGSVRLLAEMPGRDGLVVLAQQDVQDGKINLVTYMKRENNIHIILILI